MNYTPKTYNDILNALGEEGQYAEAIERALEVVINKEKLKTSFDVNLRAEKFYNYTQISDISDYIKEAPNGKSYIDSNYIYKKIKGKMETASGDEYNPETQYFLREIQDGPSYNRYLDFMFNIEDINQLKNYTLKIYKCTGRRRKGFRWQLASTVGSYQGLLDHHYAGDVNLPKYPDVENLPWLKNAQQEEIKNGILIDNIPIVSSQYTLNLNDWLLASVKPSKIDRSGIYDYNTSIRFIGQRGKSKNRSINAYSGNLVFKFVIEENGTKIAELPNVLKVGQKNNITAKNLTPNLILKG